MEAKRRQPEEQARDPGHGGGDGNRPPDAPAVFECEIRRRIPADAHERPLAERDLARVAGDDVQPEQRDEVQADERHVSLVSNVPRNDGSTAMTAMPTARHTPLATWARRIGPHTRLVTVRPKRPSGFTSKHEQEHAERDRQLELLRLAHEVDIRLHEGDAHSEDVRAEHGAERAVQAAEHGRRERVDDDREHVVRIERRRRDHRHQPGDGAEGGSQPPAEGEHHDDADPEQPARVGPYRGSAHHEACTREAEDEVDDGDADKRHAEDVDRLLRDGDVPDRHGLERERAENVLRLRRPDPGSRAVQDDEQRDRADDDRDLARPSPAAG